MLFYPWNVFFLFFLQVFVDAAVYPYYTSHNDKSHRRENHKAVVDIAVIIAPLGYDLIA